MLRVSHVNRIFVYLETLRMRSYAPAYRAVTVNATDYLACKLATFSRQTPPKTPEHSLNGRHVSLGLEEILEKATTSLFQLFVGERRRLRLKLVLHSEPES